MRPLPDISSYQWLSSFRDEVRCSGGVRGSGGVACLIRDHLFSKISLVHSDSYSRFMWIRIDRGTFLYRDTYIVVYYFPLASSYYAIHSTKGGDPYEDLLEHITRFSAMGDIIILGNFNVLIRDLQPPLHDRKSNPMCTTASDPSSVGLLRLSEDC